VIDRFPLPLYVAELADVLVASGKDELAEEEFGLLEVQRRLFEANGVNVDVDVAVFNADHGLDLADSLQSVEAEWAKRKSVFVADALAWLLHAAGRDAEALTYADEALRLGTRSALFYYHRSVIQSELGNEEAARTDLEEAVAINPRFSILHSAEATKDAASD
jgi:tetratricopeptide (TPR) repeat protein